MKKQSLFLLTLLLSSFITSAQTLKPNTTIKAKEVTFITKEINNSMAVVNRGNTFYNKVPKNRNPDMIFELKDKLGLQNAFIQVFSDERLKQLIPEKHIIMTFYVNPSGQIMEISFILNRNTLVTAQELEDLQKAIKANVSVKIRPEEYKGQDFFDVTWIVGYSKILNRTFK